MTRVLDNAGRAAQAADLHEANALLERVYQIAEDLADHDGRIPTARARRAGRRICNLIDRVDETLGLDGEG